ncbi:hypothetical protein [Limosilactobacillus ingluviei]|uniref:Uncharacterized protein n=1 Tax=Limosilactobacillus ingluviei DSM 15946 TaxID=1423760 RepID=A0A0R1UE85_9LACO|nr:hypothetical protein [Limosilactobacillus ingluviei]KRL91693.1 hypothetical protein FC43_GL001115 [Limosilactobacillus ingluviei DSM 15946]
MKKTIKYLDNDGNYQYATVKDAGDLDKLKTKAKEDLVSAINELATNGIAASDIDEINNKVDQIQQQANQNADALNMSDQERQEMQQQIAQMQAEVQAKVAELQKLAEEQNKKLQEASAELKKKADAIDVQKMQQDNAEALKNSAKALEDSLAATNEDLQKTADHLNEMEIQAGVVETSVKELQNGFESKVSSADFNEARTKLQEQETMVRQLNNELSTKASNNELDMVTQRVQKAESDIQQNAQGIKASVTKETMYKEMDDFTKYRENRLKYSRDFSNDWSLNGNDIIDDDHLFDTQHDVKSVSIRNGAYLTQTTDLDTDDMSKTFTLAMWVEKGKKPRAWYGSAELTNMKVKEDKGEYQRVYWTFVPTIVKQDIRITGDTSTQGNLIISEPKLEQSDRPSAWSTNTGDQYATTEKLAHDLKLTADKLESTITKQSEFSDRQQQDESRITQTEHGVEVANQTIVAKTDGLRQEFDGKISATSKSLTSEYQSFTNQAIGQMADGGSNLILNSSFGNLKNSYDKWTNVSPKVRIVEDDNGLKWAKMEQSGLTADSPIGLTSNLFRVKKGIVTVALDIRTDNAGAIDNDNIVILESYNADQKRVFTQEVGFSDFKITRETLFDHGPHRVTYKYNQTRDDTQYMAVHIVLPKNGVLYVTNVLARTVANGEDSGEYAPNAADLHEQVVQQRTRIEQNDHAIALKADQTKVTQDIDAAKSSLSGAISRVEQRAANLEVKADGITSSVSTLSKTIDGISVGGTNLLQNSVGPFQPHTDRPIDNYDEYHDSVVELVNGEQYTISGQTNGVFSQEHNPSQESDKCVLWLVDNAGINQIISDENTAKGTTFTWEHPTKKYVLRVNTYHPGSTNQIRAWKIKIEKGNKPTDWSPAPEDTDSSISSLQSRASKLEQTDSEIKASVTSVTNDLKNGRGTIKEGILSMTDDHFSTKFSSIDNKIDGISVGGTNYMSHNLISAVNSTLVSYDGNTDVYTVTIPSGAGGAWGGGIGFNKSKMEVPWGQAYTDSIEVYVTNPGLTWSYDINNHGVVADSNLDGNDNDERSLSTQSPSTTTAIPTNQWVKVSFTAWNKAEKNKNHTALWDESTMGIVNNTGQSITVKFRHPQQELGTIATDWSPTISELSDGGSNIALQLMENTGNLESFIVDDTANKQPNGWKWGTILIPDGLKIGDTITVSAETKFLTGNDPSGVQVVLYDEKITKQAANQQFLRPGRRDSVTLTVTQDSSTLGGIQPNKVLIYSGAASNTQGKKIQVDQLQIERGSIAHNYVPATVRKTDFDVSIDGIRTNVTNLQNNTLQYSSMEQTADGFKFTVGSGSNQKTIDLNNHDNILVGTSPNWRRIPLHSSTNPWWHTSTANTAHPSMIQFGEGTTFVYSIDVKNTSNRTVVPELIWLDSNGGRIANSGRWGTEVAPGETKTAICHPVAKPKGALSMEVNIINTDGLATGDQEIQLRNEKLEVGDNPTPWCASSQDRSGNLFTGSSTFEGFDFNSSNVSQSDNWKDANGNIALKQNSAWNGNTQVRWLPNGTYTFSGLVYIEGNDPVYIYTNLARDKDSNAAIIFQQSAAVPNVQNRWQKFVFPFEVSEPGNVYPRVESSSNNTKIHIGSYKLEKGLHNDAEWSDNPKTIEGKTTNLQKGLSAAQATIEQNSNSIALKVDTGKVINSINASTEGVKIDATKIQINGNTSISGTLNVPTVILKGKSGQIDLTGSNITISNSDKTQSLIIDSSSITIGSGSLRLKAMSYGMSFWGNSANYSNGVAYGVIEQTHFRTKTDYNGLSIGASPTKNNTGDNYDGGNYIAIGYSSPTGEDFIQPQLLVNWRDVNINGDVYKKGIHLADHIYPDPYSSIYGWQSESGVPVTRGITILGKKLPGSVDPNNYYTAIEAVDSTGKPQGNGIQFNPSGVTPYGRIITNDFYFHPSGAGTKDGTKTWTGLAIGWLHVNNWDNDGKAPCIIRVDLINGGKDMQVANGGFVFHPQGNVSAFWGKHFINFGQDMNNIGTSNNNPDNTGGVHFIV